MSSHIVMLCARGVATGICLSAGQQEGGEVAAAVGCKCQPRSAAAAGGQAGGVGAAAAVPHRQQARRCSPPLLAPMK